MTAPHIIDPAGMLGEALSQASPDLMRSLLQHVINALLSAYVDTVCGAQWGQQDPQRHARHNGYRYRPLDTRVGTIDVAIPKLRSGTYFPRVVAATPQTLRKRLDHSGRPLLPSRSVYTPHGQARQNPGDQQDCPSSQVSRMATDLDEHMDQFRHRPLHDAGPFTFVAADALTALRI